eukprot:scaffold115765_cov72-Phaeocystis_antarctica.AAC.4
MKFFLTPMPKKLLRNSFVQLAEERYKYAVTNHTGDNTGNNTSWEATSSSANFLESSEHYEHDNADVHVRSVPYFTALSCSKSLAGPCKKRTVRQHARSRFSSNRSVPAVPRRVPIMNRALAPRSGEAGMRRDGRAEFRVGPPRAPARWMQLSIEPVKEHGASVHAAAANAAGPRSVRRSARRLDNFPSTPPSRRPVGRVASTGSSPQ